jgi:ribosomal protein L24E
MFMRLMSHKPQTKVNQQGFHPADVNWTQSSQKLHVSAVLTANFKQGVGNLTQ